MPTRQSLSSLFLFLTVSSSVSAWVPPHTVQRVADFLPNILQPSANVDPTAQAQILIDIADVTTNFVVLFAPETIILRSTAVLGKLLELTADYLPDHSLRAKMLPLDVPILVAALFLFYRSASPIVQAQFVELTHLDHDAFELLFEPVGVNLLQYKCMKATGCFDWVTKEPGKVLIDERDYYESLLGGWDNGDDWKYFYWQYNGEIIRSFKGSIIDSVERTKGKHIDSPEAMGLLGDTRFLYHLEREHREGQTTTKNKDMDDNEGCLLNTIMTIQIGTKGAKMLRIDSHKLFDEMEHDAQLESSIRLLLLKSLKLKIGHLVRAQYKEESERSENNDANISTVAKQKQNETVVR